MKRLLYSFLFFSLCLSHVAHIKAAAMSPQAERRLRESIQNLLNQDIATKSEVQFNEWKKSIQDNIATLERINRPRATEYKNQLLEKIASYLPTRKTPEEKKPEEPAKKTEEDLAKQIAAAIGQWSRIAQQEAQLHQQELQLAQRQAEFAKKQAELDARERALRTERTSFLDEKRIAEAQLQGASERERQDIAQRVRKIQQDEERVAAQLRRLAEQDRQLAEQRKKIAAQIESNDAAERTLEQEAASNAAEFARMQQQVDQVLDEQRQREERMLAEKEQAHKELIAALEEGKQKAEEVLARAKEKADEESRRQAIDAEKELRAMAAKAQEELDKLNAVQKEEKALKETYNSTVKEIDDIQQSVESESKNERVNFTALDIKLQSQIERLKKKINAQFSNHPKHLQKLLSRINKLEHFIGVQQLEYAKKQLAAFREQLVQWLKEKPIGTTQNKLASILSENDGILKNVAGLNTLIEEISRASTMTIDSILIKANVRHPYVQNILTTPHPVIQQVRNEMRKIVALLADLFIDFGISYGYVGQDPDLANKLIAGYLDKVDAINTKLKSTFRDLKLYS